MRRNNQLLPIDPLVKYDRAVEDLLTDIIDIGYYVEDKKSQRRAKRRRAR